jgi:hypothetical protein
MTNKLLFGLLAATIMLAGIGIGITGTVFAEPSDKETNRGLAEADERIYEQGPGFPSSQDEQFHTGTGQGGFCVSGVCPER